MNAPTLDAFQPRAVDWISTQATTLEGLNGSVPVPPQGSSFWRNYRAFVGPAFLISVGYMDPGNWATDLKAGAQFRYGLLWVVVLASAMAIVMQLLSARLGIVSGKDLAQACRDCYPRWSRWPNWIACELAIVACDLAEVLGSAVAINLLFDIPLFWAVLITAFDVLLLLALQGLGMRFIEAIVLVLVATIGGCYFIEIFVLPQFSPDFLEIGRALVSPGFHHDEDQRARMIVLAIGIVGATVMPHNLYLHSALVRTRRLDGSEPMIRRALKFNAIDTVVALSVAFVINSAILVLAAMVFYGKNSVLLSNGVSVEFNEDTDWIRVAYLTLAPLLGISVASILFAVALLASGQSSTITGTLAGQVVMEGFMLWRIRPWVRRLITRSLAIIPAILVIGVRGERSVTDLLVLSQVVLGIQLPFAMFPLLHFNNSKRLMGGYRCGWLLLAAGWFSAIIITVLVIYGLPEAIGDAWRIIVGP
jgi:manganese transport protein